jgi:two-component system NtrC family sensor kinase
LLNRLRASLTAKLLSALGILIMLGSAAFWYTTVRTGRANLMDNTLEFVASFSEVVKKSIRYDMLLFKREDIQRTVESIGASESVKAVRVFNGSGVIFFSSEKDEVGRSARRGSPACAGCHDRAENPSESLTDGSRMSIYEDPSGSRVLSYVDPIYNEPECYSADCHAHAEDRKVLGILTTDYSLLEMDMRIKRQMADTSVYMLAFLAVAACLLYLVLWRFVLRPVSALSKGMERVTSGDLSQKVPARSRDEIGALGRTFNEMTGELGTARHRMERWTQSLEEEVDKKTLEIRKTRDRLLQAEKLAAVGRLTSEIAHEIRNPLTALGGFGRRLRKMATGEREKEYADIVVSEVDRLENILRDVLRFSRQTKPNLKRTPLTGAVKATLATFSGICEERSITCEADFGTELPVLMDEELLKQAANNLMSNAVDAMPRGGRLTIRTAGERVHNITYAALHVSDTGPGIPEDNLAYIFEPFYTTKIAERGTGLGLSISRKIIEEMGGFIKARNDEGGGATVSLYFPYVSEEENAKTPCWEFMECGRGVEGETRCPAYPNFGRVCWVVAGTFCEGRVQGTFAQKCEDCRECPFYNKVLNKEI